MTDSVETHDAPATRWMALVPLAVGLIALAVYISTMNRTIGVVDSGELAACAFQLGVPHPSGYPTLMLLGCLLTHGLPWPPILTLNLLAAVLTAGSTAVLTLLFDHVLVRLYPPAREPRSRLWWRSLAGLAALFTAGTDAWWSQATAFEVYSLHALMLALVSWLFLRYVDEESAFESHRTARAPVALRFTRRGAIFGFALGVSFTNHMTTGLLAPAFLLYYFQSLRASGGSWAGAFRRWLCLAPFLLLGVIPPYAWMMIRAGTDPPFNWGDPSTPARLLYHLSGGDYRHAMGHFLDPVFWMQVNYFVHWIAPAVAYAGLVTGLFGLAVLFRHSGRVAVWSGLFFLTSVSYACGYAVNDIGNYFMPAVMMVGLWTAVTAAFVLRRLGARVAGPGLAALVLLIGVVNYGPNDQRGNTTTLDFTRDMLDTLPPEAIVLTRQWDFWGSGSLYVQGVTGFRRDVIVIDADLLNRDWYVDQLIRSHPEVMAGVAVEAAALKTAARRIDESTGAIEELVAVHDAAYQVLLKAIVDRNVARHPCFVTYDPFPATLGAGYRVVPYHLARQLTPDTAYVPAEFPRYRQRVWRRQVVPQIVWTQKLYGQACLYRAAYELENGHPDLAQRYGQLAVSFDPGFRDDEVPVFPGGIERQIVGVLQRFRQAREDLGRGVIQEWHH